MNDRPHVLSMATEDMHMTPQGGHAGWCGRERHGLDKEALILRQEEQAATLAREVELVQLLTPACRMHMQGGRGWQGGVVEKVGTWTFWGAASVFVRDWGGRVGPSLGPVTGG